MGRTRDGRRRKPAAGVPPGASPPAARARLLRRVFRLLALAYGPQHWWPARTPYEVVAGAVLTQNTSWANVERALRNLASARALSARGVAGLSISRLERLIRPAGYFRQKARTLVGVTEFVLASGGLARLARRPAGEVRRELLAIRGIGPETADSILLYALGRPVFVVDAYTRRIGERIGILEGCEPYEEIRAFVERGVRGDAAALNELHALLVGHAKRHCRKTPVCDGCSVRGTCAWARQDPA